MCLHFHFQYCTHIKIEEHTNTQLFRFSFLAVLRHECCSFWYFFLHFIYLNWKQDNWQNIRWWLKNEERSRGVVIKTNEIKSRKMFFLAWVRWCVRSKIIFFFSYACGNMHLHTKNRFDNIFYECALIFLHDQTVMFDSRFLYSDCLAN